MMITKMTRFNMKDFNKPNESFVVSGRIIPSFEDNVWTYTEEKFAEPYVKKYDDEDIDVSYIEEEDKVVFFYYAENDCVGRSKHERGVKVNYIYKKKEKKNGNCIISIRDKWENALIEFEQKNNQIEIMINYRNEKTTKFSLPIETFEKVYEDIKIGRRES